MRRVILYVHQGLAWVILAGVLLQFYLAGMALFGAASFEFHRTLGYLLTVPILLLLILALVGLVGWRLIALSALLVILTIVQMMLPSLRISAPWVAALHPVNALALLGVSVSIALQGRAKALALCRTASDSSRGEFIPIQKEKTDGRPAESRRLR
jgi:Family of unknown function (DUF6220)